MGGHDQNTTSEPALTILVVATGLKPLFRIPGIYTSLLPEIKDEYGLALSPDDQAFVDVLDVSKR